MPALADRTNKTTVVPSRYAAAGQKSGMPSIRSQLEQAASARDEATKRCAEAIEAKAALESREQATRAAGRCATQIMSLELRQMEQATRASAEDHTQTVKQLETATAGLEQARAHEQASESALEKERETNCGLVRRVEDLEAQLASCHAGLTQLRDSALPAAASQAAAAEARLHRTFDRHADAYLMTREGGREAPRMRGRRASGRRGLGGWEGSGVGGEGGGEARSGGEREGVS